MSLKSLLQGAEPSLRTVWLRRAGRRCVVLGRGHDRSGVIERIARAHPVEALGDAEAAPLFDVEAGVEAAFDVEGEAQPGVAGPCSVG